MKKREIIEELNNKNNLLVIGDSSLVLHGLKRECESLEIEDLTNQEYDLIDNIPCLSIKSCHTQKIAGSHTVIVTEGKEIPDTTLNEAAIIASYNSKARNSTKVAVDYTLIKNVKKPSGAKPGMVVYETYKTAIVTPDEELVKKLSAK